MGSSPLARGLPCTVSGPKEADGIIPARAGFTLHCERPEGGGWDHPRSRGVYQARRAVRLSAFGSSPLARGLQCRVHGREDLFGIIPARAGFTTCRPTRRSRLTDHPRSRGVYARPS